MIDINKILGRRTAKIDLSKSLEFVKGKRILITGAGGTIGSELSRQMINGGAQRLYLFGHGEQSIFTIEKELW